jgi:hypothetical protein
VTDLPSAFLLALAAAVLAVAGNSLLFRFQTRAKVREELRQFVRELHPSTVDTVADLDLFVRELRSPALGPADDKEIASVRKRIRKGWEGDLLPRMRRLRYGHPDPDVRRAAEVMEDEMWPLMSMAKTPEEGHPNWPSKPPTQERRGEVLNAAEAALAQLRLAVYNAPRRDVPRKHDYTGYDLPSRTARAMRAAHPERFETPAEPRGLRAALRKLRRDQ